MRTIAFLSQKGGSGKTTLAIHTAVAAQEAGERVMIIDTDPQKSATMWSEVRTKKIPVVTTVAAEELKRVLLIAKHKEISIAIIDTAPHASPNATLIARLVDLITIPCRPTAFDIAAVSTTVNIGTAAGVSAVFVLSACPIRSPEIIEARTVLAEYGLTIAPIEIINRRAFVRAITTGRAVTEFEKNGKAATEIRLLWKWLREQV